MLACFSGAVVVDVVVVGVWCRSEVAKFVCVVRLIYWGKSRRETFRLWLTVMMSDDVAALLHPLHVCLWRFHPTKVTCGELWWWRRRWRFECLQRRDGENQDTQQ